MLLGEGVVNRGYVQGQEWQGEDYIWTGWNTGHEVYTGEVQYDSLSVSPTVYTTHAAQKKVGLAFLGGEADKRKIEEN